MKIKGKSTGANLLVAVDKAVLKELESCARENATLHYEDAKAASLMDSLDWDGYYPEVDGHGYLTGDIVDIDTEGYINVDDEVYVREDALSREQLRDVNEGRLGRIAEEVE